MTSTRAFSELTFEMERERIVNSGPIAKWVYEHNIPFLTNWVWQEEPTLVQNLIISLVTILIILISVLFVLKKIRTNTQSVNKINKSG